MMEFKILPTLLVYEQVSSTNQHLRELDSLAPTDMHKLLKEQRELQSFMDQWAQAENKHQNVQQPLQKSH